MQEYLADGLISCDRDDGKWRITLNRADKANALTEPMLQALVSIMAQAGEARVLVLTGAGPIFSAGADLAAAKAGLATSGLWEELSGHIANLPGLTIAALNGTLAGGAMGMALACDLRLCVPDARFFYPVMSLGFLPQPSDPARMRALIGPARTKLILMSAQKVSAEEALQMGLVDRIVAPDTLLDAAEDIAHATLQAPSEIARGIKRMCS